MTITTVAPRRAGPFAGSGTAGPFTFTFKTTTTTDVWGYRRLVSDGSEAILIPGIDFSVALNADQDTSPGGTITLIGMVLASGYELTIVGLTPATQGTNLINGGGWNPNIVEDALDRTVALVQRQEDVRQRSMKVGESDDLPGTLPVKLIRQGKYLAFDSNGVMIASSAPSGGIATSAFIDTLLDDTTAKVARTTLGVEQPYTAKSAAFDAVIAEDRTTYIIATADDATVVATIDIGCNINGTRFTFVNEGTGSVVIVPEGGTSIGLRTGGSPFTYDLLPNESQTVEYWNGIWRTLNQHTAGVYLQVLANAPYEFVSMIGPAPFPLYSRYEVDMQNITTSVLGDVILEYTVNRGSSWVTATYDYCRIANTAPSPTPAGAGGVTQANIVLGNALAVGGTLNGIVNIWPTVGRVQWQMTWDTGNFAHTTGSGRMNSDCNGFRIRVAGAVLSGRMHLIGHKNS